MRNLKIFAKVLLIVTTVLIALIVASFALIYQLLPGFYQKHEVNRYDTLLSELLEELSGAADATEELTLLTTFDAQYDVNLWVYDQFENDIFTSSSGHASVIISEADDQDDIYITTIIRDSAPESVTFTWEDSYVIAGEVRYVNAGFSLDSLIQAKEVILEIYPFAFTICLALSVLAALIISNLFVKRINKMNATVRDMAKMEPNVMIPIVSNDEIGELSQNVNLLYQKLMWTIDSIGHDL